MVNFMADNDSYNNTKRYFDILEQAIKDSLVQYTPHVFASPEVRDKIDNSLRALDTDGDGIITLKEYNAGRNAMLAADKTKLLSAAANIVLQKSTYGHKASVSLPPGDIEQSVIEKLRESSASASRFIDSIADRPADSLVIIVPSKSQPSQQPKLMATVEAAKKMAEDDNSIARSLIAEIGVLPVPKMPQQPSPESKWINI